MKFSFRIFHFKKSSHILCFFNIISPLMSILMAVIGWKIVRRPE